MPALSWPRLLCLLIGNLSGQMKRASSPPATDASQGALCWEKYFETIKIYGTLLTKQLCDV